MTIASDQEMNSANAINITDDVNSGKAARVSIEETRFGELAAWYVGIEKPVTRFTDRYGVRTRSIDETAF